MPVYCRVYSPFPLFSSFTYPDESHRATVVCWGRASHIYDNAIEYGSPHVFFRVVLYHTIVIPQQLSCPSCTSNTQHGCAYFPQLTYKVLRGNVVGPASRKGTLKVLVSQAKQEGNVQPLLITAVKMITAGSDAGFE